ncbi:PTS transporter subunit IIC [Olsenella uli]|uniref:PTS transporter subunit IIC n=1 Tax=Olsenella uli TaxID=133926 RepID=UPI0028EAF45D|nr:PTS transporter subunit IIC [Olsenella uli]
MEIIVTTLQTVASMGPMVMMPLIILVLGLIFRVKANILLKSALLVGIGFAGVNMVINWFVSQVAGSVSGMVANWGIQTSIMDVGWPARAAATWAFPLAAVVVFVVLGANALMLLTKTTKTVMVDFWSYNHFIFTGALVWYATNGNPWVSIIAAAVDFIITIKIADWTTPVVEDYFELEGVNFPTSNSVIWAPVSFALNKLWDVIPGINRIDVNPKGVQEKFGFVGEPMFMGFIIGAAIGILAGDSVDTILIVAMSTAVTMILTPKMMQILMEGLLPFADAVKDILQKKFPGTNFTMGVDAALTIANESAITVGIIMVPITLLLAAVLPGNKLLPIADIAYQAMWLSAWPVAFGKGNIFRGILSTVIITCIVLWIATALAPVHTQLAISGGFVLPDGMQFISTEDAGEHVIGFISQWLAGFIG